jgi:hypothetical protein
MCILMIHVAAILVVGTKMKCRQYPFCVRRSVGTENWVVITAAVKISVFVVLIPRDMLE